jgi:putative ABC transport system substrate-binding protein
VSSYSGFADKERVDAFRTGLRDLGYTEGTSLVIEYRPYGQLSRTERKNKVISDLAKLKCRCHRRERWFHFARDVKQANATIPIVMTTGSDPVSGSLISGLARPGGNVTGLTSVALDLSGKRVELLKETVPKLSEMAILTTAVIPRK